MREDGDVGAVPAIYIHIYTHTYTSHIHTHVHITYVCIIYMYVNSRHGSTYMHTYMIESGDVGVVKSWTQETNDKLSCMYIHK